jgi:hypothetical protein
MHFAVRDKCHFSSAQPLVCPAWLSAAMGDEVKPGSDTEFPGRIPT